jgi:hypothetical protein
LDVIRPADTPPLGTIRSLAYPLPVIEEMLDLKVSPEYFQYLSGIGAMPENIILGTRSCPTFSLMRAAGWLSRTWKWRAAGGNWQENVARKKW